MRRQTVRKSQRRFYRTLSATAARRFNYPLEHDGRRSVGTTKPLGSTEEATTVEEES